MNAGNEPASATPRADLPARVSWQIRPIGPADVALVLGFFAGLSPASRAFFHPHPFDTAAATALCHRRDPDTCTLMAVTADPRMIGYAFFSGGDRAAGELPVLGVGVVDAQQGQGVGTALMNYLHREARWRGWPGLRLTVYKANSRARRLYERFGYAARGDTTSGPSAGEEIWMEKRF